VEEKNSVSILFISKYSHLYTRQHQWVLFSKSVDAYWYSKYIFVFFSAFLS